MGGKATEKYGTTRMSKEEYKAFCRELLELAESYNLHPSIPAELPGKDSFGDVDLVFTYDEMDRPSYREFRDIVSKDGYTPNGHVRSCAYKGHQVDLIGCRADRKDAHMFYLSYGMVGMVMGVIARQIGFKFGMDGLYLRGKDKFDDIFLTASPEVYATFFGFDLSRWQKGFETVEEVYEFLASQRFSGSLYQLQVQGNAKHRKREHQSRSYNAFFDWYYGRNHTGNTPVYHTYDSMLLIKKFLPWISEAVTFQIKDSLYRKYVAEIEARRYDFESFSEIYVKSHPTADKPEIGKNYGKFKAECFGTEHPRKEYFTHELIQKTEDFSKEV